MNFLRDMPSNNASWPNADRLFSTLRTRAFPPQELPGIDPAAVAVVPVEVDRVFSDWSDFERTDRLFVHGQSSRFGLWRLTDFSSVAGALLIARRTGTRIAQPCE